MISPKVLFVSEGYGKSFFGVAQVLMRLASCCRKNGLPFRILVAKTGDVPEEDLDSVEEIPTLSFTGNMRWHPRQTHFLVERIAGFAPDVVHIHGVLTSVQVNAMRAAREAGMPVVVSPHGMLEPWLWRQKGLFYYGLRRLYWQLLLKPVMKRANYVHAITMLEAETLQREFRGIPRVLIPNAVDLSEYEAEQQEPDTDRYLLFLGRLHPVKGVDLLIEAFGRSDVDDIRLIIAGPDFDADYTRSLKAMVEKLGLLERISFVGPVYGDRKNKLLQKAWCTVVPSHSEVIAMVNLESAASFTPTITTTMTGLNDWEEGGGLLVEPKLDSLTGAIGQVYNWSVEKRMQMGQRAREFAERRYSWEVVGKQWADAYRMIAGSGHCNG